MGAIFSWVRVIKTSLSNFIQFYTSDFIQLPVKVGNRGFFKIISYFYQRLLTALCTFTVTYTIYYFYCTLNTIHTIVHSIQYTHNAYVIVYGTLYNIGSTQ
uniref:Uncharacterized protein n=1 Tax=Cacopsylla melanoneura TaxID=428564 RepID=A0A8D8QTJ0_9HEMI